MKVVQNKTGALPQKYIKGIQQSPPMPLDRFVSLRPGTEVYYILHQDI